MELYAFHLEAQFCGICLVSVPLIASQDLYDDRCGSLLRSLQWLT